MGKSSAAGAAAAKSGKSKLKLLKPLPLPFRIAISRLPRRPGPSPSRSGGRGPADRELCSPALGRWAPGSAPPLPPARPGTPQDGPGSPTSCKVSERVRRRPPRALRGRARGSRARGLAEKELENLEKWKEQQRVKLVTLVPTQLGGSQSEAEVRQKQQLQLMRSKYQQKLKREEYVRSKKRVEEAKFQQMKAIQRQKSSKLEEKERLQENLRREAFREHRQYKTAEFLSRLDTELPDGSSRQMALHDPQSSAWARSWAYKDSLKEEENKKLQKMKEEQRQKSELLEFNRQQQEEERTKARQVEHRRVNNAFLDRLQGKSQPGGFEHSGGHWNMNSGNSWGDPAISGILMYDRRQSTSLGENELFNRCWWDRLRSLMES
uniref:Epithelial stromal interaction 1 n=1 Tax=Suricata suricatta TaxID=37032 RepID=A0A673T0Y8_SURSU